MFVNLVLLSKCLAASALPQPILTEKESHAQPIGFAVRQPSGVHQAPATVHQSTARQQTSLDLSASDGSISPPPHQNGGIQNVHQPKHHQQSSYQTASHPSTTQQIAGYPSNQPLNPTAHHQPAIQQQQSHLEPSKARTKDQQSGSSGGPIIFPAEEDTVLLSNSSYELINKNAPKSNVRNSKNVEAAKSPNQTSIDALAMPELAANGKPRCLSESSFYCESVESYPK